MRLSELPDGWTVAVDTEASGARVDDGARVSIVSFAFRKPESGDLVAKAIPFDQGHKGLPLGDKDIPLRHCKRMEKWAPEFLNEIAPNLPSERYAELLAEFCRFRLVYHNRKFDEVELATGLRHPWDYRFWEMYELGGKDPRKALEEAFGWDTMVAAHVIDPQFPLGLKATATRLELTRGGEDEAAQAIKPFLGPNTDPRYDLVPWSVIGPYAAQDAILALLLEEWQSDFIADGPNKWLQKILETDFTQTQTLIHMEYRGMGWNVPLAKKCTELLKAEQKRLEELLPFRVTPPGAKKFFFGELVDEGWGKQSWTVRKPYPGKTTPTGAPQLDTEVQLRLIDDGVEWAEEYHRHEKVKSALVKWYVGWTEKAGRDHRLRCDYDQTGVATGRLGGRHINLVAIPHNELLPDVPGVIPPRGLIEPRRGFELWEIDTAQAEVRVGAAIAECVGLLEGFCSGVDAHSQMARLIFGDSEPLHRRIAKTLNLAIQYGAGIKKIQAQLEKDTGEKWTQKRTREIYEAWHQAAPEMSMAMDLAQHQAESLGYVRLWNNRFRWFEHYRGGPPDQPWTAFNAKCQGGVAEVMKICMNRWDREYPDTLVNQIHDSLVLELPIRSEVSPADMAERCADMMVEEFERAMTHTWKHYGAVITMPFEAEAKKWEYA